MHATAGYAKSNAPRASALLDNNHAIGVDDLSWKKRYIVNDAFDEVSDRTVGTSRDVFEMMSEPGRFRAERCISDRRAVIDDQHLSTENSFAYVVRHAGQTVQASTLRVAMSPSARAAPQMFGEPLG